MTDFAQSIQCRFGVRLCNHNLWKCGSHRIR